MSRHINIGVLTRYTEANYHGTLLQGIHQMAKDRGANLFVINTYMIYRFNSNQLNRSAYYNIAFNHIDGWIVLSEGADDVHMDALSKSGKPIVCVSINSTRIDCSAVKDDGIQSAGTAVKHLIEHGHKNIAYLGWLKLDDMVNRLTGYKKALEENGIDFEPELVVDTDGALIQSGKDATENLLKKGKQFSAVFAGNDEIAIGVMETLREANLRIPEDVAVIGYDDSSIARKNTPSLSSMHQNILDIGIAAANKLMNEIEGKDLNIETVYIKSELVPRSSCGCEAPNDDCEALTQGNIELKNTIIKCLEDTLYLNSDIGTKLLTTNIEEIKKLLPRIINNYSWECIAFWEENIFGENNLNIQQVFNAAEKKIYNPNVICTVENFPPKEYLPHYDNMNSDDIIWILPLSSTSEKLGIISYISRFNKASTLFAFNASAILFTLLGIAMDRDVAITELKSTLDTLQQAQEQLMQSGKMVSLGGLVAGVAHEINTPIGVSITAATYMEERSNELAGFLKSGKLKRSDLESYLEMNAETTRILRINLNKASSLINSFKKIAVDQSIEEKRKFKVKEYINEVLLSLNPKIKKTKISIIVDCPEDLEIYTYPGGLSQIVTNLVINSIMHAFDDAEEGEIKFNITKDENDISFIYSDNGKGIVKNNLDKIFEPFFTTRRGSGGTGLGLNIIFNIVTQEYGGSIKCESELGKGAAFIIKIPVREVQS